MSAKELRVLELEQLVDRLVFLRGSLVEATVDTTATRVNHRLKQPPKGVIVLSSTPDSALGFSTTQPTDLINAVNLEASAQAAFKLWFW
jgi:hypothetical protein